MDELLPLADGEELPLSVRRRVIFRKNSDMLQKRLHCFLAQLPL